MMSQWMKYKIEVPERKLQFKSLKEMTKADIEYNRTVLKTQLDKIPFTEFEEIETKPLNENI